MSGIGNLDNLSNRAMDFLSGTEDWKQGRPNVRGDPESRRVLLAQLSIGSCWPYHAYQFQRGRTHAAMRSQDSHSCWRCDRNSVERYCTSYLSVQRLTIQTICPGRV